MIKVDSSAAGAVAQCTAPGCEWSVMKDDKGQAYSAGTFHQRHAHPADVRALRTVEALARRHR